MESQTDTPIAELSIQPTYSDAETEASSKSDKEVAVNISSDDSDSDIPTYLPVIVPSTSRMPGAISSSKLYSRQQLVIKAKLHRTYPLLPCHQLVKRLVK